MFEAEQSSPGISSRGTSTAKPQRVLACVLCQQRKVKCDRNFPCSTCSRSGVQCVPIAAPRQRRRRFPERELLERVRHLENLLRQNNIDFDPLHTSAVDKVTPGEDAGGSSREDEVEVKVEETIEAKNLWHAMNPRSQHSEEDNDDNDDYNDENDLRDAAGKKTWDQLYSDSTDHLFFGPRIPDIDLSLVHPDQVQIFRLWQLYLENVNPLLKVTHTPTLQTRIIDAAGNLASIEPTLEALMFSMYCAAIMTLDDMECLGLFGVSREDLLRRYRFGCQQALLRCGMLQSDDRDSLTALFLYLVAVRLDTDPRSLSSLLGLTIRVAQRMGIDNEATNARHGPLEGEMRRRLWWSIILFDARICEMADYRAASLSPAWTCKTPSNLNDTDIQPGMKNLPQSHDKPTEATFAILRNQVVDLVRHSLFFLDFTNPALKSLARPKDHGGTLEALECSIEETCLQYCNPENPFHFATLWGSRGHIARFRLFEQLAILLADQTDESRRIGINQALIMLDCDTKIMSAANAKRYHWFFQFHFPFPAYVYILQFLKREPLAELAERCWRTMSESSGSRAMAWGQHPFYKTPLFRAFARIVVKAWEAREMALGPDKPASPPSIVTEFKLKAGLDVGEGRDGAQQFDIVGGMEGLDADELSMPLSMGLGRYMYNLEAQEGVGGTGYSALTSNDTLSDVDMGQLDWSAIDWSALHVSDL